VSGRDGADNGQPQAGPPSLPAQTESRRRNRSKACGRHSAGKPGPWPATSRTRSRPPPAPPARSRSGPGRTAARHRPGCRRPRRCDRGRCRRSAGPAPAPRTRCPPRPPGRLPAPLPASSFRTTVGCLRGAILSSAVRARNSSCSVMRASRAVSSAACATPGGEFLPAPAKLAVYRFRTQGTGCDLRLGRIPGRKTQGTS